MIIVITLVSILVFLYAFKLSGIPRISREVFVVIHDTLEIIRDKNLSDEAREKGVRAASLKLFKAFLFILGQTKIHLFYDCLITIIQYIIDTL